MPQLRLFIAADVNYGQRTEIERLMTDLKKGAHFTSAQMSWTNPNGLHITLKFLGGVEEARVGTIVKGVTPVVERFSPFDFSLGDVGMFPDGRQPRVLWIGVKTGRKEFGDLAMALERVFDLMGFATEKRPFSPHLTLARVRSPQGIREMMDIVESHRSRRIGLATLDTITLYESRLAPEGATYRVLHRWSLKGLASE